MDLSVVPYESKQPAVIRSPAGNVTDSARYRECLRNHAASMGGQIFDGCGEFMPSSADSLKCAACGCHRNFHRREGGGVFSGDFRQPLLLPSPPGAFPPFLPTPFAGLPSPAPERARLGSETPPRMDGGDHGSRKRIRTKFTAEQKEKMQAFAEKIGWRIQKHDDLALEEFCVEIGVKRHVLKVWMHNNKNHLSSSSAMATANGGNGEAAAPPAAPATVSASAISV